MSNFLQVARSLLRRGKVADAAEDFNRVFDAISDLQIVSAKSDLALDNIEAVFAAFEMAEILKTFDEWTLEDIPKLAASMRALIARTVGETLYFPVKGLSRLAPFPYPEFAALLQFLRQEAFPEQSVSVITFNYDLALDFALREHWHIDYALSPAPHASAMPLLKLHGSMNWFKCADCPPEGLIVPWDVVEFLSAVPLYPDGNRATVMMSRHLERFSHSIRSRHNVAAEPVLVPPTWNKHEHHQSLSAVWARAAKELKEAEEIYVIGYSLPETDQFFRYLFSLGTIGEAVLERFWVFDIDATGAVDSRFKKLLSPAAERKYKYWRDPFSAGISRIRLEYKTKKDY